MTQPEKLFDLNQIAKVLADMGTAAIQPEVIRIALNILESGPEAHAARKLRYKAKTANKELGRAGARIYELRAQLAEARSLHSKQERSSYRTLLAQNKNLQTFLDQQISRVGELNAQLTEASLNWVPRQQFDEVAGQLNEANTELERSAREYVEAARGTVRTTTA
jgi:hypothetical protein